MIGSINNRLAPTTAKQREPITRTTGVVNSYYTTPVIGGNAAGPAIGWEAIQPKPTSKPAYVAAAQQEVQDAWADYLWLCDVEPTPHAALEEAWERYDIAKGKCEQAWDAWNAGYIDEPIPF